MQTFDQQFNAHDIVVYAALTFVIFARFPISRSHAHMLLCGLQGIGKGLPAPGQGGSTPSKWL